MLTDDEIRAEITRLFVLRDRLTIDGDYPAAVRVRQAATALRDVLLTRLGHRILLDAQACPD